MSDDVRSLIKIAVVTVAALYVWYRYYQLVKRDEEDYRARRYVK